MAIRSLNSLRQIRFLLIRLRRKWLSRGGRVVAAPSASISLSAKLVPGGRGGISIGATTLVAFKTLLIARDETGQVHPIRIGSDCFIGGGAMILPGVTIGDGSIVGAGAVVRDDVPPGCAVGGNPAKILRENISVGRFGRLTYADDNSRRYWR